MALRGLPSDSCEMKDINRDMEKNGKLKLRDKQKMIIHFSFQYVSKSKFSVCILTKNPLGLNGLPQLHPGGLEQ